MRRRDRGEPVEPPAELLTFTPGAWLDRVAEPCPVSHGYVDDAAWLADAEAHAWSEAREVWAEAQGWPLGPVDRHRDELRQRREGAAARHGWTVDLVQRRREQMAGRQARPPMRGGNG